MVDFIVTRFKNLKRVEQIAAEVFSPGKNQLAEGLRRRFFDSKANARTNFFDSFSDPIRQTERNNSNLLLVQ